MTDVTAQIARWAASQGEEQPTRQEIVELINMHRTRAAEATRTAEDWEAALAEFDHKQQQEPSP